MAFSFSEDYYHQYARDGFVVFGDIVPPSLISDLRTTLAPVEDFIRENPRTDHRAKSAKKDVKPDMRRYGPVSDYAHLMPSFESVQNFCELPALMDAVKKITTADSHFGTPDTLEVLRSPVRSVYSTPWHRDFLRTPGKGDPTYQEVFDLIDEQPGFFHQFNCPLYRERSLWYVPASFSRPDTTDEQAFDWGAPGHKRARSNGTSASFVDREKASLAYARSMPGAVELSLEPGDFVLYRNTGWHMGRCLPYQQRLTFHNEIHNTAFDCYMDDYFRMKSGYPRDPAKTQVS